MSRADVVTSGDIELLRAVARGRSVARAARALRMSRDRAVYRLDRLARAFGGPIVVGVRGGAGHGGSALTPLGDRIVRGGFASLELLDARPTVPLSVPNLLRGVYHGAPPAAEVHVRPSLRLKVTFPAEDGASVALLLDPEAVVVARRRFASSARNVLAATVEAVRPGRRGRELTLVVRTAGPRLRVALTEGAVRQLGLAPGVAVWLYVKATALRPVSAPAHRPR